MKKKKTIIVLIIGMIFGLIISGIGTYAATSYAISSNKVSYTDNSGLGVDNVQAAIDGTCSNIDTRLDFLDSTIVNGTINSITKSGNTLTIKFNAKPGISIIHIRGGEYRLTAVYNVSYSAELISINEANFYTNPTYATTGSTAHGFTLTYTCDQLNNISSADIFTKRVHKQILLDEL